MTGLQPDSDRIIEIALLVTDSSLATLAEGPVLVVHQPAEVLDAMDSWNKSTHGKSGLVDKVRASNLSEADVEARLLEFLKPIVPQGVAPLAGNTVHQDRRFMARYLPAFDAYLHYRIVDVSTLKELARRWRPDVLLSDIGMPGDDGYVLIRKVRALGADQGGQVRALALTAYARSEDRVLALEAGFHAHIAKTVDPLEVAGAVARMARRS